MSNDTLRQAWAASELSIYGAPSLYLDHGLGCRVWDVEGNAYLDLLAGIAVASTGHAHPHVVDALRTQAGKLLHVSNLYGTEANVALARRLTRLTGMDRVAFGNSGGEANELALKLVRRHAHAEGLGDGNVILAFDGSFHGRSVGALSLTGQPKKQVGFGPLLPGVVHVSPDDPAALEAAFDEHPVAGVFYEPVQGEGGIRPLPDETAATMARLAADHGALLVADEVQTGVGRTGRFLASDHLGLRPDIVTLAKGIASGVPMGATLVRGGVKDLVAPGDHGCTFGGGPLASAAALATLDVIEEEGLVANAAKMGELLSGLVSALPGVSGVRGLGLLLGVMLDDQEAGAVAAAAVKARVLVGTAGGEVLRLAPPLILSADEAAEGAEKLAAALAT